MQEQGANIKPLEVKNLGPIKWCKFCHRKHPSREECDLVLVTRTAKSGRVVNRWAHPEPRKPGKRKTKARKS